MSTNLLLLQTQLDGLSEKLNSPALLAATQTDAWSGVVSDGALVLAGLGGIWMSHWLWSRVEKEKEEHQHSYDVPLISTKGMAIVVLLVGVIGTVVGIGGLVNPWTWVGVQHPEVVIAQKVMNGVVGK